MTYNPNPDGQGWVTVRDRLTNTIGKWQKTSRPDMAIDCPAAPRYTSSFAEKADRAVSVTFRHPGDGEKTVTVDRFPRPVDNLWALALGLDAIRLNEQRGLDDVARQMYQMIAAPRTRDPYEILGVRPDADEDVIDAAYRAKAKRMHPDAGGSVERMAELNAAWEAVKAK